MDARSDWYGDLSFQLDVWRCRLLRQTLHGSVARRLFQDRALRLGILCSVSMGLALILAGLAPLFMLALGPICYGLPHLVSSVRYLPLRARMHPIQLKPRFYLSMACLLVGLAALRLATLHVEASPGDSLWTLLLQDNRPELMMSLACLAFMAPLLRCHTPRQLAKLAGPFVAFTFVSLVYPAYVLGALLLGHHFIAFVYWRLACRNRREQRIAELGLALFTAAHVLIFLGYLDALGAWAVSHGWQPFAALSLDDVASSLEPWALSPRLWRHALTAYAFGQSVHYIVWLRAIPEQHLLRPSPVTWRQSLGLLRRDFGKSGAHLALTACLGLGAAWLLAWSLGHFTAARTTYFCLASGHGYLELAGLLVFWASKGTRDANVEVA